MSIFSTLVRRSGKRVSLRRVSTRASLAALASAVVLVVTGGPALAVTVQPGASGNACSGYQYVEPGQLYWQTCTWVNSGNVWFTVNFGNNYSVAVTIDSIFLAYYKAGAAGAYTCPGLPSQWFTNFRVPKGVSSTPAASCRVGRQHAAYQSTAIVLESPATNESTSNNSPTVQVL
jgi:hypothetical protein